MKVERRADDNNKVRSEAVSVVSRSEKLFISCSPFVLFQYKKLLKQAFSFIGILFFIMSKNVYAVVEMRKEKMNCETDSYRNSRFNAVKHGGYSTSFLSLSKEERERIFDRLNRGEKRLHGVNFKT